MSHQKEIKLIRNEFIALNIFPTVIVDTILTFITENPESKALQLALAEYEHDQQQLMDDLEFIQEQDCWDGTCTPDDRGECNLCLRRMMLNEYDIPLHEIL